MSLITLRRKLIRSSSPLVFPGTKPGIFSGFGNVVFSAVPSGSNFNSLLQGANKGSIGGSSISAGVLSSLGSIVTMPNAATSSSAALTFPNNISTNFGSWTCAAIVQFTAFTATQWIFCNSSNGTGGVGINVTNAGVLQATLFGVVVKGSGLTLSPGVPYFILASEDSATTINFLVLRLDNGTILIGTNSGGSPAANNGTYTIGNGSSSTTPTNGSIAAVAFLSGFISPASMRIWASDPWSFWYPRA